MTWAPSTASGSAVAELRVLADVTLLEFEAGASRTWQTIEELAAGVRSFVESYNDGWLIERHGHCTPREAYARALQAGAA